MYIFIATSHIKYGYSDSKMDNQSIFSGLCQKRLKNARIKYTIKLLFNLIDFKFMILKYKWQSLLLLEI